MMVPVGVGMTSPISELKEDLLDYFMGPVKFEILEKAHDKFVRKISRSLKHEICYYKA